MGMMLAARYLGPDRIEAQQVLIPTIGPEEALVQVEACGFCGSDINIIAGTLGVGVVASACAIVPESVPRRIASTSRRVSDLYMGVSSSARVALRGD